MLLTITRGKAGRLQLPGTDASLSWRDVFRGREDLLTGVIFGRFRFLSAPARQRVMSLLIGAEHAASLGDFRALELWPKLRKLQGRAWVEPDVLMTFEHALVLAEIKPPDGGIQSEKQWRDEILALLADDVAERVNRVHFVALGNTRRTDGEFGLEIDGVDDSVHLSCHSCEWKPLAAALPALQAAATGNDVAAFNDWVDAFELFGMPPPPMEWADLVAWSDRRALSLDSLWHEPRNIRVSAATNTDTAGLLATVDFLGNTKLEIPAWP